MSQQAGKEAKGGPKPRVQQPWELEPTPTGFRIPPPPAKAGGK